MNTYCLLLGFIFIIGTYLFANESKTTDMKALQEKAKTVKTNSKEAKNEFIKEIEERIKEEESCREKHTSCISELKGILSGLGIAQKGLHNFDLRPFDINLEVAKADEPGQYAFSEAEKTCKKKGMRLPTTEELGQMFCHANLSVDKKSKKYPDSDPGCKNSKTSETINNLTKAWYWSSNSPTNLGAITQYFGSGYQFWNFRLSPYRVRCVRIF